jgi:hypothetical protein
LVAPEINIYDLKEKYSRCVEGRALRKIIVVWTKFYYIKKCKACCTEECIQ